jgi:hypothetical protein
VNLNAKLANVAGNVLEKYTLVKNAILLDRRRLHRKLSVNRATLPAMKQRFYTAVVLSAPRIGIRFGLTVIMLGTLVMDVGLYPYTITD